MITVLFARMMSLILFRGRLAIMRVLWRDGLKVTDPRPYQALAGSSCSTSVLERVSKLYVSTRNASEPSGLAMPPPSTPLIQNLASLPFEFATILSHIPSQACNSQK